MLVCRENIATQLGTGGFLSKPGVPWQERGTWQGWATVTICNKTAILNDEFS